MSHLGDGISEAGAAAAAPQPAGAVYGVVAEFGSPEALVRAARSVRRAGYAKLDAYSPFPIHGIDEAMGATRSRLGFVVFGMGLVGLSAALMLQWWTGAVAYPLVIGGKPLFALEFSIPITFELTVLLAAFGAVFGMLGFNGLPRFYHPIVQHSRFAAVTDDAFLLAIEADGKDFQPERALDVLEALGGRNAEVIGE
jgi:hypothetical protein